MPERVKLFLKIIGWAVLLHVVLIALTILEVFIYSTFVNRGQDNLVYEAHAEQSGPYIGIIAGFVLTYLIAFLWSKKAPSEKRRICIGLPIAYIVIDIIILLVSGTDPSGSLLVFFISYATKLMAGYLVLKR